MKWFRTFVGGILAGISIAIGGTVFLSLENKVLGALFFTVGLFAVCTFGFNLFTGKVCYMFDQDKAYALGLPLIWLGNLAGTFLTALAERATRVGPALAEKAQAICTVKLNDGLLSIFILSFFCNVLIWLAVEGFKNNPHPAGKDLSLFIGVAVFIRGRHVELEDAGLGAGDDAGQRRGRSVLPADAQAPAATGEKARKC